MEVRDEDDIQRHHHQEQQLSPTSSKQVKSSPNPIDTNSVTQRLQKELMALMMAGGDLGVSAFPEGESIFYWIGTIEGGKGTMYEGLSYKLSLRFPLDYPFKPPQVKFETTCFHPNVDHYGNICLDILQNPIQRALSIALPLHFGRTRKSTKKWCANITWLDNHLRADLLYLVTKAQDVNVPAQE